MLKKHRFINTLVVLIVLQLTSMFAKADGTENDALKLFQEKEYATALPVYVELNKLYPNEAKFLYYLGICLTETGNYDENSRRILLRASLNSVPNDIFFYVGKNYHANNEFETALEYYQQFEQFGKNKQKKALGLTEFIEKAKEGINPFSDTPTVDQDWAHNQTTVEKDSTIVFQADSIKTEIAPEPKAADESLYIPEYFEMNLIEFNITTLVTYCHVSQFKQHEALKAFISAWKKEQIFVEKQNLLTELRNRYNSSTVDEEKNSIANQILGLETELFALKAETDGLFHHARTLEEKEWVGASLSEKRSIGQQCDSIRIKLQLEEQKKQDSIRALTLPTSEETTDTITASEPIMKEETENTATEITEVQTSKVVYKVQIGRSAPNSVSKTEQQFKKISKIRRIDRYTDHQGMIAFTVGELTNLNDAVLLQKQIRLEGIKDAFVIAFQNGKRITLNEAKAISEQ